MNNKESIPLEDERSKCVFSKNKTRLISEESRHSN